MFHVISLQRNHNKSGSWHAIRFWNEVLLELYRFPHLHTFSYLSNLLLKVKRKKMSIARDQLYASYSWITVKLHHYCCCIWTALCDNPFTMSGTIPWRQIQELFIGLSTQHISLPNPVDLLESQGKITGRLGNTNVKLHMASSSHFMAVKLRSSY